MDYADRHGIVVIDETPAVGLNMGLGGGIFGAQGYTTFSPETVNERTREVHAQVIRELVARDKNHPSVVLWSIANEPESDTDGAERYFEPLFAPARELDPTRPVGFVNVMLAPHGTCRVSQFGDVLMLNRYYGWYVDTGDLAAAERGWEEELRGWASDGQADHHHRVRRRHLSRTARAAAQSLERGVPGRLPGDEPPRVRPLRRGRRRAGVELRRLRHHLRDHAGSAATRRASSPGTASPRPPHSCCVADGGARADRGRGHNPHPTSPLPNSAVAAGYGRLLPPGTVTVRPHRVGSAWSQEDGPPLPGTRPR